MSEIKKLVYKLAGRLDRVLRAAGIPGVDKGSQILLRAEYLRQKQSDQNSLIPMPNPMEIGFKAFSQFEEDGILLWILTMIGTTNLKCIEMCAGNGIESNTANLILNWGFHALLLDGDIENTNTARNFYERQVHVMHNQPTVVQAWLDKSNVAKLVAKHKFDGDIDILSIDVDGNDYWLWEELTNVNPRIVVCEFNSALGMEPLTVRYRSDFQSRSATHPGGFEGASLGALVKLAKKRGYRLVGTSQCDLNAFFVRNDIGIIAEADPTSCFKHPRSFDEARKTALKSVDWETV